METLSEVSFTIKEIYEIVKKTNGCIVWGGSINIAPADDNIIRVEEPLLFESYDKILVSIMAKKIAFGSNHVVIDVPYGKSVKVQKLKDAEVLKEKFEFLAKKFEIKLKCLIHRTDQPFGRGVGPILETREAVRVLQQKKNRPLDLEVRSLNLASTLLEICLEDSPLALQKEVKAKYGNAFGWATHILSSGKAFAKMQEIIKAQKGNPKIDSEDLRPGKFSGTIKAKKSGKVKAIHSKNTTVIARILGAPLVKEAGIYFDKQIGDNVTKGEELYTMYTPKEASLKEAKDSVTNFPIFEY
jgi:AMP phosphorylase